MRGAEPAGRDGRALTLWLLAIALVFSVSGCEYGRMFDDEAINTYQTSLPNMPPKTAPIDDGAELTKDVPPGDLKDPLPVNPDVLARGKERYGFYCSQCHGPKADGNGTVGQSFAPLPTNLTRSYVQGQNDGVLFIKISFGFRRHPPLGTTVAEDDRWAIIHFLRSIAEPKTTS